MDSLAEEGSNLEDFHWENVFGSFVGRPDGFGSSVFAQVVDFYALSIYMGFLG